MTVRVRGGRFMIDLRHHHEDGRVERIRVAVPKDKQSKRAAEAYERTVLADLRAGISPRRLEPEAPRVVPTLAAFTDEFMEACKGRGNKPRELATKLQILTGHLLPAFGDLALDTIDERKIDRYRDAKIADGLSSKTVRNHLEVLRRALRIAHRRKVLATLPTIELPRRQKQEPNFLTFDEADRFLAAAKDDWRSVFLFAMRTGLRLGEIKGLRWRDVDIDGRMIRVRQQRADDGSVASPKSGQGRTVHLAWDVVEMLHTRPRRGDYVFDGVTDRSAWWAVTTTAKRAKIGRHVHPHDLRHSFGAHAVMRGVDLITLKEWMGHHSVVVTEIYAHVCGSHRAACADLLAPRHAHAAEPVRGHSLGTREEAETRSAP